ncbi:MAG: hypothetical protein JJ978_04530 [Roseivirga sp.]|jgi:hypothetical protein|uniref:hypothetical protein n=1 Tax=Roseivirga sp. TaxID=1964215 RepID=UPI001B164331|nr:hypothetical protein [Roseivirga sp.]MBO6494812.1 hypothetical protein [Roseivirga sp.]
MNTNLTIPFALRAIETHQFAIIKESFKKDSEIELQAGVNVGASDENHSVSIFFEVRFLSDQIPFIILEIECQFEIEVEAYSRFFNESKTELIIPSGLCQHLGVITVGTARGILYEKLRDSDFDYLLLPTVDLTVQLSDDIVLKKEQ